MNPPSHLGFSHHDTLLDAHIEGGDREHHEDWQDWLRWDPAAADATSPDDGTFNSGSSKNDSPLQDPPFMEFGTGDDDPLVRPFIVDEQAFGLATVDAMMGESIFPGIDTYSTHPSDFANTSQLDGVHNLQLFAKSESSNSTWAACPNTLDTLIGPQELAAGTMGQAAPGLTQNPSTSYTYTSPASTIQNNQNNDSTSQNPPKKRGGRKRKAEVQIEKGSSEGEDGEIKTSHNAIEKRYRNNLNDKIVELRNSVPSLRAMGRANEGGEREDLEGLTPAHKLNKATVMAKATEYIKHLEKRNKTMAEEMASLKAQLEKVESAMGGSKTGRAKFNNGQASTRPAEPSSISQSGVSSFLSAPQDQSRINRPVVQQQYTEPQEQLHYSRPPNPPVEAQNQQRRGAGRGGLANKVLLGTMASVMVMEGFSEEQGMGEQTSLGAMPMSLFSRALEGGLPELRSHLSKRAFLPLMKFALVFGILLYLVSSMVAFVPRRKQRLRTSTQLPKAPSLASPVEVRRKAWDTAIQSVWVPKHFLLEVASVGFKMLQLSVRRLIGSEAFVDITGTNREEEAARVKAWDIAIDAQLAGGDAQVSYYRLLLTLMESGTLPDSPVRLMQKAVHFRVFFWEVANAGYGNMVGFKQFTERVGKFYWDSARRLQKELSCAMPQGRQDQDGACERLPDHLARLVELDCEEVLSDEIIQRAWNLAWNKPSAYKTAANAARDSVIEDHAIRSPLDAVAAWYANVTIDDTLADTLSDEASTFDLEYYLGLALSVAPPASSTHVRALAAKAVLSNSNRDSNIVVALESLPVVAPPGSINLVSHAPAAPDVCIALTLAKLISLCSQSAPTTARERAADALTHLRLTPSSFTLLTAVASHRLLRAVGPLCGIDRRTDRGVETLAASLRIWVGTSAGRESGLGHEESSSMVRRCLQTARAIGGWDDEGYWSAPQSASSSPAQTKSQLGIM